MTPVTSSQIESIGHDAETNTLHIRFHRGGLYTYADFPAEKFTAFQAAESKGKYLSAEIKGKHEFTKHSSA